MENLLFLGVPILKHFRVTFIHVVELSHFVTTFGAYNDCPKQSAVINLLNGNHNFITKSKSRIRFYL